MSRARLADPQQRRRISDELDAFWGSLTLGATYVMHVGTPQHQSFLGRTLDDIAAELGVSVGELCCILMEDERSAVQHLHRHGGDDPVRP